MDSSSNTYAKKPNYRQEYEILLNPPTMINYSGTGGTYSVQQEDYSTIEIGEGIGGIEQRIEKDEKWNSSISAFDVARYILSLKDEPCTTMKLHKLLYYCQAWYLVWEEQPLFKEKIEAWANGPVIRELFSFHKGLYRVGVNQIPGNIAKLSEIQKEDIQTVLHYYGEKTSQWLIDQTHSEMPWQKARRGLAPNERGNTEIKIGDMLEYYSSLS